MDNTTIILLGLVGLVAVLGGIYLLVNKPKPEPDVSWSDAAKAAATIAAFL
jgi:hypothetical protein